MKCSVWLHVTFSNDCSCNEIAEVQWGCILGRFDSVLHSPTYFFSAIFLTNLTFRKFQENFRKISTRTFSDRGWIQMKLGLLSHCPWEPSVTKACILVLQFLSYSHLLSYLFLTKQNKNENKNSQVFPVKEGFE